MISGAWTSTPRGKPRSCQDAGPRSPQLSIWSAGSSERSNLGPTGAAGLRGGDTGVGKGVEGSFDTRNLENVVEIVEHLHLREP